MFGKFGGYLAAGTGVIGLILGLVFGGMWAGSASITAEPSASASASPAPTATLTNEENPAEQPGDDEILAGVTAAEMKLVNDPKFPEVRYQFQLDFFNLAIANCEKLEQNGVVLSFADGRTAILGKNKTGVVSRIDFDTNGLETQRFVPTIEDICMPKYFHDEVLRGFARNQQVSKFYHLDPLSDGGSQQYAWHQHIQSPELSTVYFDFTGGVLTSITDWDHDSYAAADVKFGLTKAQKALLQDVDF
jgi:hypothetical protein